MASLANEFSLSPQDIALLAKCKRFRWESIQSVLRRIITAHFDGKKGFSGSGFLLLKESNPLPFASRREIYVRIVERIYDLDSSALDKFFEMAEVQFIQNRRYTIRAIAKSPDDLYCCEARPYKPYQRLGQYYLATSDNIGVYDRWLELLLKAIGLDAFDLVVFWR